MNPFDTSHFLSIQEQQDVFDLVEVIDKLITDDIYDRAESYELIEDEETYITTLKIYDEDENVIVSCDVGDYDQALAILEEIFGEVEPQDDEDEYEDDL